MAAAIARRRSEDALREVEARYQRIAANTAGMVFQLVMKPDFSVTAPFISEGCRQVYELEPAQLQSNPKLVNRMVHPQDKAQYNRVLREAVANVQPFQWEGRVLLPSGTVRWVAARAGLDRQANGDVNWNGVVLDVSELERAQEAMLSAKEEAERANAAKSLFLSRMSHELRTPLNAILGFGQVLELSPLDEQDGQCVHHILKGGRHLLSLVDEVLDLSRVESGQLALRPAAMTFDRLMQDCAGLVAKMAQARGTLCTVRPGPECHVPIWADEQRLRQILLNLLANAIKYGEEDGQVTLRCQEVPGGHIRCLVQDTGPGITPEGFSRLFVPFERLEQELGDKEGTGLGLVVSQRLAEAMDGKVGGESTPNVGSTFWVEMPVARGPEPVSGKGSEAALVPLKDAEIPAEATVLYVEDNASNLAVVTTVMKRLRSRWRFLSAVDGQVGLQLAREQRPDVILLDLQLPGLRGDVVLTELRAEADTKDIPVLMLSADATAHSRERLLALGANAYVAKPFVVTDLLITLDGMLLKRAKK